MSRDVYGGEYQEFLARLRSAREKLGLTQAEAARRLGKPQSFVSKSESGERRVDVIEAARFARLYGVSIDELIGAAKGVEGQ